MRRSYCNQQSLFFEFPSIFLKIRNGVNSKITKLVYKVHKVHKVCKVIRLFVKAPFLASFGCHSCDHEVDPKGKQESRGCFNSPQLQQGEIKLIPSSLFLPVGALEALAGPRTRVFVESSKGATECVAVPPLVLLWVV